MDTATELLAEIEETDARNKEVNERAKNLMADGTRKDLIVRWPEFSFGCAPVGFSSMKLQELRGTYAKALARYNDDTSAKLKAIALEAKRRIVANKLDITPFARRVISLDDPFGEAGRLLEDAIWKVANRWRDVVNVVREAVLVRDMADRIDALEEYTPENPAEEESRQLLLKEAKEALDAMVRSLPRKQDLPSLHLSIHTLSDYLMAHPRAAEFATEKREKDAH